ncbi:primase-helicase zinc-binding domain-containing protein [Acidisphaera rubrifaciens]|uniref:primase-helicase zinc-binding domain-containing protein n=1 Tax=Acidisphaera rubrifaciens TaxID=50715 RepID=UPI0027390677|nr:primase-helicase zinc-binding domain-containing protein [Acidisphaera rubrifaciens]
MAAGGRPATHDPWGFHKWRPRRDPPWHGRASPGPVARGPYPFLGVDARYLVNRHGPCPVCGGRDRLRFDDKDGSGSFYCNQCGPGAALYLLRRAKAWDHTGSWAATRCR